MPLTVDPAGLVSDLGFLVRWDLPTAEHDALLVVALRETPTTRHYDPELISYWQTGEDMLRVIPTKESGGQLTMGAVASAWPGDVAAAVLRRLVISVPNSRFDIDPAGARFLVLEKATADSGPDLKSPIVVLGSSGDR